MRYDPDGVLGALLRNFFGYIPLEESDAFIEDSSHDICGFLIIIIFPQFSGGPLVPAKCRAVPCRAVQAPKGCLVHLGASLSIHVYSYIHTSRIPCEAIGRLNSFLAEMIGSSELRPIEGFCSLFVETRQKFPTPLVQLPHIISTRVLGWFVTRRVSRTAKLHKGGLKNRLGY